MSRIDQALRRAAGASATQPSLRVGAAATEAADSLEAYAAETTSRQRSVAVPVVDPPAKAAVFVRQPSEPRRPRPAELQRREEPRDVTLKSSGQTFLGFSPELL